MRQWYEELFDNYAKTYDKECFTQGTAGECDFIEKEIGGDRSKKILDIGCGTGRHSIELVKRGYFVTGFDLSGSQLERAREKASELSLKADFQKRDAREPHFKGEFDLAIMLCEGGFSLMETDEMNFAILKNAADALKPQGKLIFTTLNALFPLFHSVKDFLTSQVNADGARYGKITFDLMTFREKNTAEFADDDGNKKTLDCDERYYAPSEINWLLKSLGFKAIGIFGSKLGAYSREDRLTTEDFEMLVIAEK
ncbi:MAG TPA: class I SAM-dependent methyltransferase [Acidobacteriota bacterium]|nr:class I SAM-dependent methyltransferase [Acidobacteriota bacterium]HNT16354.1 class I SAM-dependent methyltransferase [Acidobacteriota bacterium]